MEEDDDFYGDDSTPAVKQDEPTNGDEATKDEKMDESLEEGEEEEEEESSDSVRIATLFPRRGFFHTHVVCCVRISKLLQRAKMLQHPSQHRTYPVRIPP